MVSINIRKHRLLNFSLPSSDYLIRYITHLLAYL